MNEWLASIRRDDEDGVATPNEHFLLAHLDDLKTRIEEELHHAEDNNHYLDRNCQGVPPGDKVPAVTIAYIRNVLESHDA